MATLRGSPRHFFFGSMSRKTLVFPITLPKNVAETFSLNSPRARHRPSRGPHHTVRNEGDAGVDEMAVGQQRGLRRADLPSRGGGGQRLGTRLCMSRTALQCLPTV
jgi:hypothetical protein